MPKTISLQEAQDQLTAATAAVDQLKQTILDKGPGSVTAEELGGAALAVEHAKLALGHAVKTAEDQAAAERMEQLQLLKRQILDQAGDVDTALDAMRQIEDAAAVLITACTGRQRVVAQAMAAMRRAGVPRHGDGQADQHAGLAWSEAAMGRADELHVDGRTITSVNAGMLVAAALARAAQQAGVGVGHLRPAVDVPGTHQALTHNPEAWLNARY